MHSTLGLQPGVEIVALASATEWMALFASVDAQDYVSVRVLAWAHVLIDSGNGERQAAFGAIVPAHAVPGATAGTMALFAATWPTFMCYVGPGQLLSDEFVRQRLAEIRREMGR